MADYAANARGHRPKRLGIIYMTRMLAVTGVFALSLVCRHGPEPADSASRLLAVGCDCLGSLLLVPLAQRLRRCRWMGIGDSGLGIGFRNAE